MRNRSRVGLFLRSEVGLFLFMVIGILSWVVVANVVFDNVWFAFLAAGVGGGVIAWGFAEYAWRQESRIDDDDYHE